MEDNGVVGDFATGTGQQERDSDQYPNTGVWKSEEFSEGIQEEQRKSLS